MKLKDFIEGSNIKFIFFGGKGGVGKTTCAASSAYFISEHLNKNVLVISTDPAHSLGDVLGYDLPPGEIIKIPNTNGFYALEPDPHKEQHRLTQIISGGITGLKIPDEIITPGFDEAIAFEKLLEFIDDPGYDIIIFDTAPTGHTLRLLGLPDSINKWVLRLLKLKGFIAKIFGMFGSGYTKKINPAEVLETLKKNLEKTSILLKDPEKICFVLITIPEAMGIFETERYLAALNKFGIPVRYLVINQIQPDNAECHFCKRRREMHLMYTNELFDLYGSELEIIKIELRDTEITGLELLDKFGTELFNK